jgi:hypothetical protein
MNTPDILLMWNSPVVEVAITLLAIIGGFVVAGVIVLTLIIAHAIWDIRRNWTPGTTIDEFRTDDWIDD